LLDGSGVSREAPAPFCERLEVKFLRPTHLYLHAYESASEAHASLERYITFYNERRPHQALDGLTPNAVYSKSQPLDSAA
jgi:putative transposase